MKIAALALSMALVSAAHAQSPDAAPECRASQLTLSNDTSHDADFNGMSHTGTMLILKNTSANACRIAPFLHVTLADGNKPLDAIAKVPGAKYMHPGPVVPTPVLPPGGSAAASIRWVNDEVFQNSFCIDPNKLAVAIGSKSLTIAFDAHMCGEASQPILFELSRFSAPSSAR